MEKYLIETPHSNETCRLLINELHSTGYLHNFEWGCEDGVHCGWAIIEAESEAQAWMAVPMIVRRDARIVHVVKFDFDHAHKSH